MSRPTSFFRTSTPLDHTSSRRDSSPLLPLHEPSSSVSLRSLSPRSSHSHEHEPNQASRRASPSPTPSFYRDALSSTSKASSFAAPGGRYADSEGGGGREVFTDTHSSPASRMGMRAGDDEGSSSRRRKGDRRIMFDAPPPPIAASMFLSPQYTTLSSPHGQTGSNTSRGSTSRTSSTNNIRQRSITTAGGNDPLLVLERRERSIQRNLQYLLDAQSAGLIHGFGGGEGGGTSEAGSNTPTGTTTRSVNGQNRNLGGKQRGITPVRQPKASKPLGLRGARRGILSEMDELSAIKTEESRFLNTEIQRRELLLRKIKKWEGRIQGAQEKLAAFEIGEEEMDGELKREEKAVDQEIKEMEERLRGMRARKRWLGERIAEGVNRREAEVSGYRGALREAEGEVKEFLRRPPLPVISSEEEEGNFGKLSVGRRTLGMAQDWFGREVEGLKERKEEVEREREASVDGARLWKESCDMVVKFEDALRQQISGEQNTDREAGLRAQIEKMRTVIKGLEEVREEAEGKGWNLLVCAVGAEVEAFRQGRGILMDAIGMVEVEEQPQIYTRPEQEASVGSIKWSEDGKDGNHNIVTTNDNKNNSSGINEESNERSKRGVSEESTEEDEGLNLEELMVERRSTDGESTF